jgi:LysM repeat protein
MRRVLFILATVLVLATSTASAVDARPNEWSTIGYHTVRWGETLFCIGRAYGVDPWAIATHNGIVHPYTIYPGLRLAIPNAYASLPAGPTCTRQWGGPWPEPLCTCASYHTIAAGENLYRISLRYGPSMWRIAQCNNIYNLHYIRSGDTLCIPTNS